jgi:hypothetical protein
LQFFIKYPEWQRFRISRQFLGRKNHPSRWIIINWGEETARWTNFHKSDSTWAKRKGHFICVMKMVHFFMSEKSRY